MAPRGGGHGGSHRGSGGSGDGSSGPPTNRSQSLKLPGSHFKKPAPVAALAIVCLCFLGLIGVAAWSYVVKSNGRKVFRWFGLPMAITAAVTYLALDIANRILTELEISVPGSYLLIHVVTEYFLLKASVLLLLVTHVIIRNRFSNIWKDAPRFRAWHLVQYAFLAVLAGLGIAAVILDLEYYLQYLDSPINTTSSTALDWLGRWRKVDAAFHCVYLIAAVDITVSAVVISNGARSQKVTSQISKYLLFLIAPPLLLRSLVLAILSIEFTALSHPLTQAADVAYAIFYGFPTVVIFAALVAIATQGDWFPEYRSVQQNSDNNEYAANPNAYQGQTAYEPQKAPESQPWLPPPPPGQTHYDTSYRQHM